MKRNILRKLHTALALAAAFALAVPWTAFADDIVAEDSLTSAVVTTLNLGSVCANTTVNKSVLLAIKATGHPGAGNNVYANSAAVAVSVASVSGTGLSASGGGTINLPSNWTSLPNNQSPGVPTLSSTVSSTVTLAATSTTGSLSETVTYSATGAKSTGGTLTKTLALPVTATVVNCDHDPPTLSLPADITAEATGPSGTVVTYSATATDANPASPAVACKIGTTPITSPHSFPLGATTVTCSASDAAGNPASASFTVTVQDTTPPAISGMPANITKEATGPSGAAVTYSPPAASDLVSGSAAVSCSPASGSTFALGITTVTCSATDTRGNPASGSFTVTVVDTTPPVLSLSDTSAEAAGASGAVVSYTASASDLVDGAIAVACAPASGATFPLSTTTVTCSATDAHGNPASGSFTVTVIDTTVPVLTLPADITAEATGPAGAAVSYSASAVDTVDGPITPTCAPASGSPFALDTTTTVACSAKDAHNNTATGSFTITVVDTTPPALTLPGNITKEAAGPSGAAVSYTASASDLVDGAITPTCSPASGSTFPLGATAVTCTATDAHGKTASGSFTVKVQDTTPPVISNVSNVTAEATGPSGAAVTYSPPAASDLVSGSAAVSCSPASGNTFALGDTTVTCTATDAAGNSAGKTFTVSVVDTTAPTLTLPDDLQIAAAGQSGALTTFSASASDLVDGSVPVSCTPASGSTFPIGVTTVNCTATDTAGKTATGSFTVQVTYQLTGFYQPANPSPFAPTTIVWNAVKGGSTVPLKFGVFAGSTELTSTSIVQQPLTLKQIACATGSDGAAKVIAATGGTSLRYDPTGGQFIYDWQTPKQPGACYKVYVHVLDGSSSVPRSSIVAYFQLK